MTASAPLDLKTLAVELQSYGVRTTDPGETRRGGAGPSDAGFLWIDETPLTVPVHADFAASSPYELVLAGNGRAGTLLRHGVEVGQVRMHPRPKIYDLETADGIPYWKIALMHLDSLASTVFQSCVYWKTTEQCHFCAIGTTLMDGRTIPVKSPAQLAEVATAAKRLDGAKDVTLTTGTPNRRDRGADYMARCAEAIRDACDLPVQVQIEPPDDFAWFARMKASGVEALGLHMESPDPAVLARVAPGKAAQGIDYYHRAWEAAVEVFGRGQVSTYFILGLGETPASVETGVRAAIDRGVYPFVVPLRPTPGSILADARPPAPEYIREVYELVAPLLAEAGIMSQDSRAGCVRCQACSALSTFESAFGGGRDGKPAPVAETPAVVSVPGVGGVPAATASPPARGRQRPDIHVAASGAEREGHFRVRHQVFVDEQGLFETTDRDVWDNTAIHVVATAGALVVGSVRLYRLDESGLWQGDRLAVLPEARKLRPGGDLVRFAVKTAGEHGGTRMVAHVQEANVAFFQHLGWSRLGPLFDYHGVLHQRMDIPLSGAADADTSATYGWMLGA